MPVQCSYLNKSERYHRDDCHLNGCTSFIASMATEQYFPDRTEESAWLIWQTTRYYCEKARRHRWTYYDGMTYAPWVSSAVGFHWGFLSVLHCLPHCFSLVWPHTPCSRVCLLHQSNLLQHRRRPNPVSSAPSSGISEKVSPIARSLPCSHKEASRQGGATMELGRNRGFLLALWKCWQCSCQGKIWRSSSAQ